MANATAARAATKRMGEGGIPQLLEFGMLTNVKIYPGTFVAITSAGYLVSAGHASAARVVGFWDGSEILDSTGISSGVKRVTIRAGAFGPFNNSASGDLITIAEVGTDCYIVDDNTVAKTDNSAARIKAGKVVFVETAGVWVLAGVY